MLLTRLGLALAAVVVAAWFVLGARQAHDLTLASNIASQSQPVTAAQAARARSLLNAAATLNPDQTVNVTRAAIAADRNQTGQADAILLRVVREEPDNLEAWYLLAQVQGNNPRLLGLALRHIAELDPHLRPKSH
jgi:hypothetical protein